MDIDNLYQEYIEKVSTKEATVDINIVRFMSEFVEEKQFKTIADLGSGFSSAVLSNYSNGTIHSVDDNQSWLEKSIDFVEQHGLKKDYQQFMHWDDFKTKKKYDFIFYDLGMTRPTRIENMEYITKEKLKVGGYVLYDDMHKGVLREKLDSLKEDVNLELVDTTKKDEFGRYAELYQYKGKR